MRIVLLMLFSMSVFAGQMDEFNKLTPSAKCQQQSMVYREGISGRNEGFGREIANLDDTLLPDFQAGKWKPDHDKMYVFGWDKLDEDIKEMFTALAQMGWDHADQEIASELARLAKKDPQFEGVTNAYLDNGKVWYMTNQFLQSCVNRISPESRNMNFIEVVDSMSLDGIMRAHRGCMANTDAIINNCLNAKLAKLPRNEYLQPADMTACQKTAEGSYKTCIRVTIDLPQCEPWADEMPTNPSQ